MNWIYLTEDKGRASGCCEHRNNISGCVKGEISWLAMEMLAS